MTLADEAMVFAGVAETVASCGKDDAIIGYLRYCSLT